MSNRVVLTLPITTAPRWIARCYADGTWDASTIAGPAISMVLSNFAECVRWARAEDCGADPIAAVDLT